MRCICVSNLQIISNPEILKNLTSLIKPGMKVVCIPFASDREWVFNKNNSDTHYDGGFFMDHYTPFYHYGIDRGDFYVVQSTDNIGFIEWKLQQADIIYFSGGFMENLIELLESSGLDVLIKDYFSTKLIIGESAGALVLGDYYYEYPYENEYYETKVQTGLGLLPNMRLIAHYSDNIDLSPIIDLQLTECSLGTYPVITCLSDEEVMYTTNDGQLKIIGIS